MKLVHAMKSQPCFAATPSSCQRLLRGWSTSLARITINLKKRTMETAEQQTGPSKRKALPSTSTQTESTQAPDPDVQADTLSSSSDSDLPLGLPN